MEKELANSDFQDVHNGGTLDDFCRSLLEVIAELSPCSEEKLFIVAATRELGSSADRSLMKLKETLHEAIQQLTGLSLVRINGDEVSITELGIEHLTGRGVAGVAEPTMDEVVASVRRTIADEKDDRDKTQNTNPEAQAEDSESPEEEADNQIIHDIPLVLGDDDAKGPNSEDEEILDLTAELGGLEIIEDEGDAALETTEVLDLKEVEITDTSPPAAYGPVAEMPRSQECKPSAPPPKPPGWASARLERAAAALRQGPSSITPRPDTTPAANTDSEPISGEVLRPSPTEAVAPEEDDLARMADDSLESPESLSVETPSMKPEIKGKAPVNELRHPEPTPKPSKFGWADESLHGPSNQAHGWLAENVSRRMKAFVPVEAEVRLSPSISAELGEGLSGPGQTEAHKIQVAHAVSLKLTAPKGGFTIESQSPETQWVWSNREKQSEEDFAAWQFTLTPTRRGPNVLRLTFSYKEIGPNGRVADSTLPDKVLDVVVKTNLGKFCARAAVWSLTLVLGAALGVYLQSVELKKSFDALGIDDATIEAFNEAGTKAKELCGSFYDGAEHYGGEGWNYLKRLWGETDSKQ